MKIAVLADIHANLQALQVTINHVEDWKPDFVIVAGDTINRGPRPQQCLNLILDKNQNNDWRLIRGNHEDYVINLGMTNAPREGTIADVHRASIWTYKQINKNIKPLEMMEFKQELYDGNNNLIRAVHASMLGNRIGVYPETRDSDLRKLILGSPDCNISTPNIFCAGHTHRPLIRTIDHILVVNAGSVGLPFDGDHRACYAQIEINESNRASRIIRLNYDIDQAIKDFWQSDYLDGGGPLVKLVLLELLTSKSHLYSWTKEYQAMALQGRIEMKDSVERYLSEANLPAGVHL